jgi:DHA1 family bicyclomycin/chloramphenicol resistance-like MFS transporter
MCIQFHTPDQEEENTLQSQFLNSKTPPHTATLTLMAGLSALSLTVIVPSLPAMTEHFGTSYGVMQLAVAAYMAMNAVLQLVIGPISDAFGRRPVVLVGLGIFCLASLGCLWTDNVWAFLGFRMVQAVISSAMVLSRAAIRDIYDQDKAASMLGYVTMGMSVVPMIGPAIGGYLGEIYGWQVNFWLLSISGLVLFAIVFLDFQETLTRRGQALSAQIREYPELLKSPRFWGFALCSCCASGAFFSYLGGAAYVATQIYQLDLAKTGLFFGMPALGYFIGNFFTGRYAVRIGLTRMTAIGCWITTLGVAVLGLVILLGLDSALVFFVLMIPLGIGNGLTVPNATAGTLSVRPHLAGSASGLGGALSLGGGAAFSALAGAILPGSTTALPLIALMLAVSFGSIAAIRYVIRREAQQAGLDL